MLPNWMEAVFEGFIVCSIVRHSSLIRQLNEHLYRHTYAPLFSVRDIVIFAWKSEIYNNAGLKINRQ